MFFNKQQNDIFVHDNVFDDEEKLIMRLCVGRVNVEFLTV